MRIRIFFGFLLTILMILITIKFINYLPLIIREDTMRQYHDIEEVRKRLNIKEIHIPVYFPQDLMWPPSEIYAQGRPYPAIIMVFKNSKKERIDLIVSQGRAEGFDYEGKLKIKMVRDRIRYSFKGRDIMLITGSCDDQDICTKASWTEGGDRITIIARLDPPMLIKIAESMIR